MRRKYKLTWFARFSLFLLILSPLCYIGVKQYQTNPNVRNTVEKVIVEIENRTKENVEHENSTTSEINEVKEDIEALKDEIDELEDELVEKQELLENLENGV